MENHNRHIWRKICLYIIIPIAIYLVSLFFCVCVDTLWLRSKIVTILLPILIIASASILICVKNNNRFLQQSRSIYSDFIKIKGMYTKYEYAVHVSIVLLLMSILGGIMYVSYFFVIEKIAPVPYFERFDGQAKISNDFRIVADTLCLDSSVVVTAYDIRKPSGKNDHYKIFAAYIYRAIDKRFDVWYELSDTIHFDEKTVRPDSVAYACMNAVFNKMMSSQLDDKQCYQVERVEIESLLSDMRQAYEQKYGENTFTNSIPIYVLSKVDANRFDKTLPYAVCIIVPLLLLFLFLLFRIIK